MAPQNKYQEVEVKQYNRMKYIVGIQFGLFIAVTIVFGVILIVNLEKLDEEDFSKLDQKILSEHTDRKNEIQDVKNELSKINIKEIEADINLLTLKIDNSRKDVEQLEDRVEYLSHDANIRAIQELEQSNREKDVTISQLKKTINSNENKIEALQESIQKMTEDLNAIKLKDGIQEEKIDYQNKKINDLGGKMDLVKIDVDENTEKIEIIEQNMESEKLIQDQNVSDIQQLQSKQEEIDEGKNINSVKITTLEQRKLKAPEGMVNVNDLFAIEDVQNPEKGLNYHESLTKCSQRSMRLCSINEVMTSIKTGKIPTWSYTEGDYWYVTGDLHPIIETGYSHVYYVQGNTYQEYYPLYSTVLRTSDSNEHWMTLICCHDLIY